MEPGGLPVQTPQSEASGIRNDSTGHENDDDFAIERREKAERPWWKERKVLVLSIAGLILIAAIATVLMLVFGGNEHQEAKPGKPTAAEIKKKNQQEKEKAKREKQHKVLLQLQLDLTADPDGNWEGLIPDGEGWQDLQPLGDQNDDSYNPRYRTVKWGPDNGPGDGFVLVDTTPAEDPTANGDNFKVNGKFQGKQKIPHSNDFAFARLVTFDGGTDDCEYGPCAKVMMSDGNGGGLTILARALSMDQAVAIVKNFAATVERGY